MSVSEEVEDILEDLESWENTKTISPFSSSTVTAKGVEAVSLENWNPSKTSVVGDAKPFFEMSALGDQNLENAYVQLFGPQVYLDAHFENIFPDYPAITAQVGGDWSGEVAVRPMEKLPEDLKRMEEEIGQPVLYEEPGQEGIAVPVHMPGEENIPAYLTARSRTHPPVDRRRAEGELVVDLAGYDSEDFRVRYNDPGFELLMRGNTFYSEDNGVLRLEKYDDNVVEFEVLDENQ